MFRIIMFRTFISFKINEKSSFCKNYQENKKQIIMIQNQTYLNVADNTGAQKLMCIQILGSNKKHAKVGEIIIAVVKVCFFKIGL